MEIKPAWIPMCTVNLSIYQSKQCQFWQLLSTVLRFPMLTVKVVLTRQMNIITFSSRRNKDRKPHGAFLSAYTACSSPENTAACAVHHAMIGLQVVRQSMVRIPCVSPLLLSRQERGPAHEHPGSFLSKTLILTSCLMFNQRAILRGETKGDNLLPEGLFCFLGTQELHLLPAFSLCLDAVITESNLQLCLAERDSRKQ